MEIEAERQLEEKEKTGKDEVKGEKEEVKRPFQGGRS